MNSERRHELQHNLLADILGEWIKKIEPYAKQLAIAFTAIVVAVVAFGLLQNSASMARSDATLELLQNSDGGDADALASVSARYPETTAGSMARLYEADTNLGAGLMALYNDREEGEAKIEDSIKAYKDVATKSKDKLLASRAYFGLGHAQESLGKLDDAITAYGQSIKLADSDAVVNAAQQRIDMLKKPETQEFMTWFAKQDFKPVDPSLPPSMPSGATIPDLPDFALPPVTPLDVPSELKSDPGAEAKPAPGEMALPAADSKATEQPPTDAAAEPASESKMELPATEPAATEPAATEPAATEPVTTESVTTEPVTTEPPSAAAKPELDNPTVRVTDEKE